MSNEDKAGELTPAFGVYSIWISTDIPQGELWFGNIKTDQVVKVINIGNPVSRGLFPDAGGPE